VVTAVAAFPVAVFPVAAVDPVAAGLADAAAGRLAPPAAAVPPACPLAQPASMKAAPARFTTVVFRTVITIPAPVRSAITTWTDDRPLRLRRLRVSSLM
jgi:hypothetical protein